MLLFGHCGTVIGYSVSGVDARQGVVNIWDARARQLTLKVLR